MTTPHQPQPHTDGWQDIATAPAGDGSLTFLAYIPGHGNAVCYRLTNGMIHSNVSGRVISRATHWQYGPNPPSTTQSHDGEIE